MIIENNKASKTTDPLKNTSVMFVCSGNNGVTPIVKAQAESLSKAGLVVQITPVIGRGFFGYLGFLPRLRRIIRRSNPDLIHAHYSLCGFVAALATSKPVITSLMGSDVQQSGFRLLSTKLFIKYFWSRTIVKSAAMKRIMHLDELVVLPNGVDTEVFQPMDKVECRNRLNWSIESKIILFAADPARPEKNYPLAQEACSEINNNSVELKVVHHVDHNAMPIIINAADVLLLTSKWEGSPNVVKEAMACNVPVVSVDVGDVKWLFGKEEGYVIADTSPQDIANKISLMLEQNKFIDGRARIFSLGIESRQIAQSLIDLYLSAGST